MRALPLALACWVLFAPALSAQTTRLPDAWQRLRAGFDTLMRQERMVGASLMVIRGDSVVGLEPWGMADLASGRAVDSNTIYHWASITKTFTAVAIMQLRDRGLLRLDDPIVRYVPELRAVHDTFGDIEQVTIRHLLSHASGFRNPTWPWGGDQPWHPFEPTRWSQLVAMMPYTEIRFPPGSRYSYSNPGYIFLGRVIEALSGDDYEVYMEKNVLRPLGMSHSYFDRTPYHLLRYRSNNYTRSGDSVYANGLDFDTGITVSNGGLNAPFTDMAKYLRFLLGTAPTEDARQVLSRRSLEEMWQGQVRVGSPDAVVSDPDAMVGLGFFVGRTAGIRLIGHTGSQASFRAFFYLDPESRTAILANFNTVADRDGDHPRMDRIFSTLVTRFARDVVPAR